MDKQRSITKTIQGLSDTEAWDLYRSYRDAVWLRYGKEGREDANREIHLLQVAAFRRDMMCKNGL